MQKELILTALNDRFNELRETRVALLVPQNFGQMAEFVKRVRDQIAEAPTIDLANTPPGLVGLEQWMTGDEDCLTALRLLALGDPMQLREDDETQPVKVFKSLITTSRDPAVRFRMFTERYRCPLNFSIAAEDDAREWALMRLMVQDRAAIEKNSIDAVESDDFLLRLNLVALHASRTTDLRFLDALNYYYESLPKSWRPRIQNDWLLVSYFAFYAQALAGWISGKYKCE